MVIRLPELLLFAEDIWKKALARLGPPADKPTAKSKWVIPIPVLQWTFRFHATVLPILTSRTY